MVYGFVRLADTRAATRLARHCTRRLDADLRSYREWKNPDRVPLGTGPADVHAAPGEGAPLPRSVRFAAQSAGRGRRAEPARAAHRHRQPRPGTRRRGRDPADLDPYWRHAAIGAGPL